jgi:hypothetical protein
MQVCLSVVRAGAAQVNSEEFDVLIRGKLLILLH